MLKNYLYTASYQLMVLFTPFITIPYLSRALGAKQLGIYSYVSTSAAMITTFCLLGLYSYGNRQIAYVRDQKESCNQTFWEILLLRLLLAGFGCLVYGLYAWVNPAYRFYFLVYFPYLLAEFLDTSWFFVGLEQMKPAAIKNALTKLVGIIGIFIFVKDTDDLWKYLLLLALATLMANLSLYPQLKIYLKAPRVDLPKIFLHLKASSQLFLPQVAALLYFQIDKVMLQWFTRNPVELAYYDQATKIVMIPLTLVTLISSVSMPRIANEYQKKNQQVVIKLCQQTFKAILLLAIPMSLGVMCIAKQFIPWYLGHDYLPVCSILYILAPVLFLQSLTSLSGNQYFVATNQLKPIFLSYSLAAGGNIALNLFLIPLYQAKGAAMATLLAAVVLVVLQYSVLLKQVPLFTCLKAVLGYGILALLVIGVTYWLTKDEAMQLFTTFKQILLATMGYVFSLILFKDSLSQLAIQRIKQRLTKKIEVSNHAGKF